MREALAVHDALIAATVESHRGQPVKERGEGDSWFVVFASAIDAVSAAADVQRQVAAVDWPTANPIRVRASVHTGDAELRDGDYYGPAVNRAARLRGIAHGGQTVLSRSTFELVRDSLSDGLSVVEMGEYRLKDLTRPEYVYQLDAVGLQTEFPPLRSLNAVANNLPIQLTDFIGRDRERREVAERLKETRMLTILAAGGSGKTRLAIQVAADLSDSYPDGVFFVPLADTATGDDIVQTITESLGIGLSADEDRRTQLLGYLAGKRQLLVFDNFEHVMNEAEIVSDILGGSHTINVLATSRVKLNVTGESVYNLSGLGTGGDTPDETLDTEAAALFIDSARRVDSSFSIAESDAESVAAIIRSTGGLPLAIVLAAAWVDMLSIGEIASEMAKTLDFLETDASGVPDRHRSIRAVFDYSWDLLSDDERATFTALSVFRGGFTRGAAERVAGASLRGLANLSSKSLLTADPSAGRYAVHELLRQYAQAELESDATRCQEVQLAHASYFADMMDTMVPLVGESDQQRLLVTVGADIDNLRTAWRHFLAIGDATNALRFVATFYLVYEVKGWYPAAIDLFEEARVRFADLPDPESVSLTETARAVKAWFQTLIGQVVLAAEEANAALDALPDSTAYVDRWAVVQSAAIANAYIGNADAMAEVLDRHVSEFDALDDKIWRNGIRNWQSFSHILKGDFEAASSLLDGLLAYYQEIDEHYFRTWALWLQAMVSAHSGDHESAIELYRKQRDVSLEIGYLRGQVESYSGLGEAATAVGRYDEAEHALVEALRISEQMGMLVDMVSLLASIASAKSAQGDPTSAVALLTHVIEHPLSERQPFTVNASIREIAEGSLVAARAQLDGAEYETAVITGRGLQFEAIVNELLGRV